MVKDIAWAHKAQLPFKERCKNYNVSIKFLYVPEIEKMMKDIHKWTESHTSDRDNWCIQITRSHICATFMQILGIFNSEWDMTSKNIMYNVLHPQQILSVTLWEASNI